MLSDPLTMAVPLRTDDDGVIFVGETRITLDTLIARHHQGDTPEAIHTGFPSIPTTDIYAVLAYYLAHQDELDAYIQRRREEGERLRQEIEANYTPEQKAFNARVRTLIENKRRS
jgi:uncharacterized protein (DUF433 family)